MLLLFFNISFFILLFVLGLRCYTQAFSSCRERGLTSSCGMQASQCGGFSLQSTGSRRTGCHCSSSAQLPAACRIFPGQGLNWYPLHCKTDS